VSRSKNRQTASALAGAVFVLGRAGCDLVQRRLPSSGVGSLVSFVHSRGRVALARSRVRVESSRDFS